MARDKSERNEPVVAYDDRCIEQGNAAVTVNVCTCLSKVTKKIYDGRVF